MPAPRSIADGAPGESGAASGTDLGLYTGGVAVLAPLRSEGPGEVPAVTEDHRAAKEVRT